MRYAIRKATGGIPPYGNFISIIPENATDEHIIDEIMYYRYGDIEGNYILQPIEEKSTKFIKGAKATKFKVVKKTVYETKRKWIFLKIRIPKTKYEIIWQP